MSQSIIAELVYGIDLSGLGEDKLEEIYFALQELRSPHFELKSCGDCYGEATPVLAFSAETISRRLDEPKPVVKKIDSLGKPAESVLGKAKEFFAEYSLEWSEPTRFFAVTIG